MLAHSVRLPHARAHFPFERPRSSDPRFQSRPGPRETRVVRGQTISIVTMPLRTGYRHACSGDDLVFLLHHLNWVLARRVRTLVLNQPRRHEHRYYAWVSRDGEIFMNAGDGERVYRKPLDEAVRADLDLLRGFGGQILDAGDRWLVRLSDRAYRDWMVYHVFLHEIGHLANWGGGENAVEQFACRMRVALGHRGVIPFEPRRQS
jgi:hypothetical protein